MEGVDAQELAQVDAKGFIPDEVRNRIFRKLRMKNENRTCFECAARNPTWCTLSYGAYLCLECSGEHRRKGVHISFVRSVELDSFTPEQIVQMAVGGNGKAWTYFKQYGMGKTGEAGKPVDYTSKVAIRYKQDHDKASKDMCASLGVACKSTTASNVQAPDPAPAPALASSQAPVFGKSPAPATPAKPKVAAKAKAVDDPWDTPFFNEAAPVPARASIAKEVPSPASTTSTMTSTPLSAPTSASMMGSSTPAPREWQQAVTKPSGFSGKGQKAKQIDFDFDFDFLEQEAAKPAVPSQLPKVAAAPSELPAAPKASPALAVCKSPPEAPPRAPPVGTAKFANKKGISSEDFFGDNEVTSKGRYTKFASAGAISSDSFFGDKEEDPADAIKQVNEDLAKDSSLSEMAKSSFMQGSEWFSQYLNKVTD